MKKKLFSLLLAATTALCFTACGSKSNTKETTQASTVEAGKTYTVGICNYVDDASLNLIVDSIEAQLEKVGNDNNVKFDINYDNCNADSSVLSQIISNFKADKVDLMIGVATPVAMEMQAATEGTDLPVVFAAVSDPISAGLVDSMEKPGKNITGTSDAIDTTTVFKLIKAANPEIKKVGLLYDLGQDSSKTSIADAKKFLDENNIEYVEKTGTNVNEVKLAAESLVAEKVEAVFTPTDNTIMEAELSIYETFKNAKIPHYTGADSFALNGAFLGYGIDDYAKLGVETANMAADILINSKNAGDVAVKTFENGTATINTDTCTAIGYDLNKISEAFKDHCLKIQTIVTAESFDDLKK